MQVKMLSYLCLLLTVLHIPLVLSQLNKKNFGPYVLDWDVFQTCKGPKPSDCGKFLIADHTNMSDVIFTLDMEKECPITAARVTISALQANNKTKKLFNYALDKPCQHFVLGPILISSFHLNDHCKINKGHYVIHLNMLEKTTMFLGPSFFYGIYEFKVTAHNRANNFFCVKSVTNLHKMNGDTPSSP